jgi:hypothetical protein
MPNRGMGGYRPHSYSSEGWQATLAISSGVIEDGCHGSVARSLAVDSHDPLVTPRYMRVSYETCDLW